MAELKTKPNAQSVKDFIQSIQPEWKQLDSQKICELLSELSGEDPKMWGDSIVGFGEYHYKYSSGREGDWFLAGFSSRKANLTIYVVGGFEGLESELESLGKHKKSVGCLYIKRLEDIDLKVLKQIIIKSIKTVKKRYADYN